MSATGMLPDIIQGERRDFIFPRFNFINQVSGVLRANTSENLKFTTHGDWQVCGINAQLLADPGAGGLASGTPIDINIFDPTISQFWWTGGSASENIGLDLASVAGVAGNMAFQTPSKYIPAGTQLVLYANYNAIAVPTADSFLTVVLSCFLANVKH